MLSGRRDVKTHKSRLKYETKYTMCVKLHTNLKFGLDVFRYFKLKKPEFLFKAIFQPWNNDNSTLRHVGNGESITRRSTWSRPMAISGVTSGNVTIAPAGPFLFTTAESGRYIVTFRGIVNERGSLFGLLHD